MKKQQVAVTGTLVTVTYPALGKSASVDLLKLSPEMQRCAGLHGLKQKLGDAESGGTAAEKLQMVQRIIDGLKSNQWELTATIDLTPLICEAVARIKKLPVGKVEKAVEVNPDQVKTWASNIKVKAEIAKIRSERAAKLAEASDDDEIEVEIK